MTTPLNQAAPSGAWMRCVVNLAQPLTADMRVDLRGRQIGVPQKLLHHPQVSAPIQHVRRKRMTQSVRMSRRSRADIQNPPNVATTNPIAAQVHHQRLAVAHKLPLQHLVVKILRTVLMPRCQQLLRRLTKRHPPLLRPLTQHDYLLSPRVVRGFVQPAKLRHPQPAAIQHLKDHPVTQFQRVARACLRVRVRRRSGINARASPIAHQSADLRCAQNRRQPTLSCGRAQTLRRIDVNGAQSCQPSEIAPQAGCFASDSPPRIVTRSQISDIAPQGKARNGLRVCRAAALSPPHKALQVVPVRASCCFAYRNQAGDELAQPPRLLQVFVGIAAVIHPPHGTDRSAPGK